MTDGWKSSAPLSALQARARLYQQVRNFFAERDVLEVDTPQLARHGVTDVHIDCMAVPGYGYLQSSPEYHMKRLLAAGAGSIWQLCKAYRQGEAGRYHNPEFTLLEWYRVGFSLDDLINEVLALLQLTLPDRMPRRIRFRQSFLEATGLDPLLASTSELAAHAHREGCGEADIPDLDKAGWVDWLMATQVEPTFDPAEITVVTDFPAWAASLAELTVDEKGAQVARRFEVYSGGVELANGYQELRDAREQAQRFTRDQVLRQQAGKDVMEVDGWLLAALASGLPPVSGVALGIERLLMVMLGSDGIDEVLSFPSDIA
jgi:lysyl-tRNA synthetase class 2